MNIRVDNTNGMEIVRPGAAAGEKEDAAALRQKEAPGKAETGVGLSFPIRKTTVDVPLAPGESQLDKIRQEARQQEAEGPQRELAAAVNAMSAKDCGEMAEDGFPVNDTDVGTIVTEMDKIKMELAKAGVDISIFGDELSEGQLEEMAGSEALARQLGSAIEKAGLPATQENVSDCGKALEMAQSLTSCGKETVKYMLENELQPTVGNLYKAQHSVGAQGAAGVGAQGAAGVGTQETAGAGRTRNGADAKNSADMKTASNAKHNMGVKTASNAKNNMDAKTAPNEETDAAGVLDGKIRSQVEQVVARAGLPVTEGTLAYGQWMIENDIPVTEENIKYAVDLSGAKFPPPAEQVAQAMLEAVSEGKRPQDAMALEGYGNAARAEQAAETVEKATDADVWGVVEKGLPLTVQNLEAEQNQANQNQAGQDSARQRGQDGAQRKDVPDYAKEDARFLTAKRQLEETRLVMTAQANYALLRRGFSLETKPLEEVVERLKSLEADYYKSLLSQNGVPATEGNVEAFAETVGKARELADAPAYVVGRIRTDVDTIDTAHRAGMAEKARLEQAGEAYEALMTAPRADMGDSIQKAFRNVGDILEGLGMEATEPNQRAVRILAYNRMEITPDSIAQIKAADQKTQDMVRNLSPRVVLEMIREGANPLEMSVDELNAKAEEIQDRLEDESGEKFSKYLWKLEQNHEIAPEERESYIGIYRLLGQIGRTDGAAVGALVGQGAELTVRNLLSAVRTRRNAGVNVSVDDSFGEVREVRTKGLSISEQIEAAYQTDCAKAAYRMATPEGLQQAAAQGEIGGMTPEELLWRLKQAEVDQGQEEEYYRQQMQDLSYAKEAEAEVMRILSGYDMPVTSYNIMAASQMAANRNGVFRTLFDHEDMDGEIDFEEVKTEILKDFGEAVKTPEAMAEAQEKLADIAENVMKTMIQSEDVRNVDVREMRIMRQQIALGAQMAKEENYAVPVMVVDEMMNVQLKIVRGKREHGRVDVIFDSPRFGKLEASFQVREDSIRGSLISDSEELLEALKSREEELRNGMGAEEKEWGMDVSCRKDLDVSRLSFLEKGKTEKEGQTEEEYRAQTRELYGVAKAFLEEVKRLGDAERPTAA